MLKRFGLGGFALTALLVTPTLAADRGSAEDQLACTPDVYRLCSQFIPDEDAIVSCLKSNKPTLSAGCQRVFSRPQPAPQPDNDDD